MKTPRASINLALLVRLVLALAALLAVLSPARAQETVAPTPEEKARCDAFTDPRFRTFCLRAYSAAPLKFPGEAEDFGFFTSADKMAIYKPAGNGPFPAIVLLHTCGPIDHQHFRYWIQQALEHGYVAFVVDSWKQRGASGGVCKPTPGFYPISVRVRDAYDALRHLGRFGFVDTSRVAAMGFSQGGRVAYHLASKTVAAMFPPEGKRSAVIAERALRIPFQSPPDGKRFAAAIAVYGECFSRPLKLDNIRADIDVPLLSLLGELDEDGDPKECLPRLQAAKDKGAPVEWHVFTGAGHTWDQPKFNPPRRVPYAGSPSGTVLYAYDAKITKESRERAFAFLARHLKPR